MDQIENIRSKFPDKQQNIPQVQKTEIKSKMNVFERASEDKFKKLILSSSSKECDMDPIPTSVLKQLSWHINNSHHWHKLHFNGD